MNLDRYKVLLNRLREDREFRGFLEELALPPLRRFKPGEETEQQQDKWIYESGRSFENERILSILGGNNE